MTGIFIYFILSYSFLYLNFVGLDRIKCRQSFLLGHLHQIHLDCHRNLKRSLRNLSFYQESHRLLRPIKPLLPKEQYHRLLHTRYKPDDNAAEVAIPAARRRYPAANHAAEALVIYDLQRIEVATDVEPDVAAAD